METTTGFRVWGSGDLVSRLITPIGRPCNNPNYPHYEPTYYVSMTLQVVTSG